MNYFTTAVLAGTLVTLIVGILLGLLRGMRRSVLRLALLVLCLVLALAICPAVSETVMNVKISDGKTLETLLTENFSNGGEAAVDIVIPIAQILAKLIAFIMLFGILQFVTWIIVFPILKLILRPLIGRRAHSRMLGALLGLVSGALVAFAVYVPMNGLFCELGKIAAIDLSALTSGGESGAQTDANALPDITGITEYADSGISRFYSSVGSGFYRSLSTVTDKNGKEIRLSAQIDALSAAANFAIKTASLKDVMKEDGSIDLDAIQDLAKTLTELDELTPEAREALNGMLESATKAMGDNVPEVIRNLDIETIDFKTEGNLLSTVATVADQNGNLDGIDVDQVVKDLSKSSVILPALAEANVTLPVDEETRAKAEQAIADLQAQTGSDAVDAETIAKLSNLFGTNEK